MWGSARRDYSIMHINISVDYLKHAVHITLTFLTFASRAIWFSAPLILMNDQSTDKLRFV